MSDGTHVLESLPAYALGCLDEAEAQLVAAHLAGCYVCRTELSAFQAVVEQLVLPAPDAAPPPELKRRLLDRVRSLHPTPSQPRATRWLWRGRRAPAWGIVSLLLIVVLAMASLLLWQQVNRVEVLTGPQGMRAIALHHTEAAPQASGFVIINADGQNGILVVDALRQLDPERQYQVWLIRDGQTIAAAAFSVDESGYRGMRLLAPESLLAYSAILITIEPVEGSASPTGEHVLEGSLHNR